VARGLRIFLAWFPAPAIKNRRDRRHQPDWLETRRHSGSGRQLVIAASPKVGINRITADEPKEALAGAHVAIDLSDSLSFDLKAVLYGTLLDG
jgi:hypothetical protein